MGLLTKEEYRAIASGLDLPCNAFVDGGYRPAISGKTFASTNPATGEILGHIAA
jgi:gamma-glutamyl-gamma-aminobutyraldehyde dehydrogenase